jgi:hypothetical protein
VGKVMTRLNAPVEDRPADIEGMRPGLQGDEIRARDLVLVVVVVEERELQVVVDEWDENLRRVELDTVKRRLWDGRNLGPLNLKLALRLSVKPPGFLIGELFLSVDLGFGDEVRILSVILRIRDEVAHLDMFIDSVSVHDCVRLRRRCRAIAKEQRKACIESRRIVRWVGQGGANQK